MNVHPVCCDESISRAVLCLDDAARILFNEAVRRRDVLLQQIAARILGFTTSWLGSRGFDGEIVQADEQI